MRSYRVTLVSRETIEILPSYSGLQGNYEGEWSVLSHLNTTRISRGVFSQHKVNVRTVRSLGFGIKDPFHQQCYFKVFRRSFCRIRLSEL